MTQLSENAKKALINAGTNRQGTVVDCHLAVSRELWDAELIGPQFGLTRKGSIARERLMDAALDEAF